MKKYTDKEFKNKFAYKGTRKQLKYSKKTEFGLRTGLDMFEYRKSGREVRVSFNMRTKV